MKHRHRISLKYVLRVLLSPFDRESRTTGVPWLYSLRMGTGSKSQPGFIHLLPFMVHLLVSKTISETLTFPATGVSARTTPPFSLGLTEEACWALIFQSGLPHLKETAFPGHMPDMLLLLHHRPGSNGIACH